MTAQLYCEKPIYDLNYDRDLALPMMKAHKNKFDIKMISTALEVILNHAWDAALNINLNLNATVTLMCHFYLKSD